MAPSPDDHPDPSAAAATANGNGGGAEAMQMDGGVEGGNGCLSGSGSMGARSLSAHSMGDSTARSTCSNNENASPKEEGGGGGVPVLTRMATRSKLPGLPSASTSGRAHPDGLTDRTNS